jgi:hypothetical protein
VTATIDSNVRAERTRARFPAERDGKPEDLLRSRCFPGNRGKGRVTGNSTEEVAMDIVLWLILALIVLAIIVVIGATARRRARRGGVIAAPSRRSERGSDR